MLPVCPAAATFRSTIIIRWRGENRRRDVSTYQVVYSCAGCCCCYRRDGAAARVSTGCRDRDVSMAFNFYGTPCLFGCGCCGRRTVHTRRCWKIWRIKLPLAASLPGIIMKKSQRQEFEKRDASLCVPTGTICWSTAAAAAKGFSSSSEGPLFL